MRRETNYFRKHKALAAVQKTTAQNVPASELSQLLDTETTNPTVLAGLVTKFRSSQYAKEAEKNRKRGKANAKKSLRKRKRVSSSSSSSASYDSEEYKRPRSVSLTELSFNELTEMTEDDFQSHLDELEKQRTKLDAKIRVLKAARAACAPLCMDVTNDESSDEPTEP